jgi:hypothetical protein
MSSGETFCHALSTNTAVVHDSLGQRRFEEDLEHDAQIYQADLRKAEKLEERGANVDRVLDYELKSEYQRWLHERDADRDDADGQPEREPSEVEEWAHDHDLPYFDEQVHFQSSFVIVPVTVNVMERSNSTAE